MACKLLEDSFQNFGNKMNNNPDLHRQQAREYYHRHKEEILAKKRQASPEIKARDAQTKKLYRITHKEELAARDLLPERRFSTAKSMAKKRKHDWTLTLEQYIELIKDPCYYCEGFFGQTLKGSGLDRKNNELGYEVNNCLSCCGFCNRLRSNVMTVEECKVLITTLKQIRINNEKHSGEEQ